MSMEKRKKTRELSEDVRHKIVAKYGLSQGCKSISRDLVVTVEARHDSDCESPFSISPTLFRKDRLLLPPTIKSKRLHHIEFLCPGKQGPQLEEALSHTVVLSSIPVPCTTIVFATFTNHGSAESCKLMHRPLGMLGKKWLNRWAWNLNIAQTSTLPHCLPARRASS